MNQPIQQNREIWLDGLRGIAAVIVACLHMTAGHLAVPYRSFWDSPASENRHLIQIAPFRVIFSGQAMVCVFFVVSGYSISVALVKLRNEGFPSGFSQRLASCIVRRIFRLSFPILAIMLVSHTLYYMGLYTHPFSAVTGCPGALPWSSPLPHIRCLVRSFVSIINLQKNQDLTLNDHLWTIPVEICGSMKVYLALIGLSTVRDTIRLTIIGLFCMRSCWNGTPEYLAFFAGMMLAECNGLSARRRYQLQPTAFNSTLVQYLFLAVGIYLICLPIRIQGNGSIDSEFTPDWFFLKFFPPLHWWDFETTARTWHTFGAILVCGNLNAMPHLRSPFETRIAQFLGRISFGLYLCHQTVYRVMLNWSLQWISLRVTGVSYYEVYSHGRWGAVCLVWIFSTALIWAVLLPVSNYMAKSVDRKSISISYHVEKLLS